MTQAERDDLTVRAPGRRPAPRSASSSETYYGQFFSALHRGVLIVRAEDGRIDDVTPYFEDLFGYTRAELLDVPLWSIGPTTGLKPSSAALRQLLAAPDTRKGAIPLKTRAGTLLLVDVTLSECTLGGTRMFQCCVEDVTEQRSLIENTERLNADLLAAVASSNRREREHRRLNRLNRQLYGAATLDEFYDIVARTARALLPEQRGFLAISRLRGQRLEPMARWGAGPLPARAFEHSDCRAARTGRPFRSSTTSRRKVCRHLGQDVEREALCVPLISKQEDTLGMLVVQAPEPGIAMDTARWDIVMGLADSVALPLFNLLLRDSLRTQATIDALTGLHNRRHLDDCLVRELHRAVRNQSPLCVAMLDIDHFKRFNDSFGHLAGDAVLRQLAALLRDSVRKSDISCRFGGEEFLLVLPDSSLADTRLRVEQILGRVRQMNFRDGDHELGNLTLSAGITPSRPQDTPHDLLSAADKALYVAKRAGRDRVACPEHRFG